MATAVENRVVVDKAVKASSSAYDMSEWYDSRLYKLGLLPILGMAVFWIWFQRTYAYSHGMDSMEPEFDQIWMGLWRFQMILWPTMAALYWGWLWKTRSTREELASLTVKQEIKRYFYFLMWLGVYLFAVY